MTTVVDEKVDEKLEKLGTLTNRLEDLEWDTLRQKTNVVLNGFMTYATEAVILMSNSGLILGLNDNARSLFQYPAEELVKQPIDILIPIDEREERRLYREAYWKNPMTSVRGFDPSNGPVHGLRRDGNKFLAKVVFIPLKIGNVLLTCIVYRELF